MPKRKGFTVKEKVFIEAYAQCENLTQAARIARYSKPEVDGWKLKQKPHIAAELSKNIINIDKKARRLATAESKLEVVTQLYAITLEARRDKQHAAAAAAVKTVAEIYGLIVKKNEDLTKQLAGKTREEKLYFIAHRKWPVPKEQKPN